MSKNVLRYDILKELFNISVGKAAGMLSEILNKKILLNVPNIALLNNNNENFKLDDYLPREIDGSLMVSSISFRKKLTGKANLIFPAEKMRTFINLCLNQDNKNASPDMNFTSIDFDIIREIGNITLNSIVGEISNYLGFKLNYSLPEVKVFNKIDFSKDLENNGYINILILYITFIIDETEIESAIIIDLTLNSLSELIKKIDTIEDKLSE